LRCNTGKESLEGCNNRLPDSRLKKKIDSALKFFLKKFAYIKKGA